MSKQTLSIEQMQHLQELGLKLKPSLVHYYKIINIDSGKWYLSVTTGDISEDSPTYQYIPAYTLQDVLDALPKCITNDRGCIASLVINFGDDKIGYYFKHGCAHIGWVWKSFAPKRIYDIGGEKPPRLLDTAYALLCWCIENKFVETNKNE